MRITENFTDALSERNEVQQVSLLLVRDEYGKFYVEIHHSNLNPRIRAEDLGTLIGMFEALQRRAAK